MVTVMFHRKDYPMAKVLGDQSAVHRNRQSRFINPTFT
jgi:hypothetical protein